jgi:protein-tyrosine-phosphatase
MAEALMRQKMAERAETAVVSSAGLLEDGRTSPEPVVELVGRLGVDLSERTSHQLTGEDLDRADIVITMERHQLREAALMTDSAWPKTFTLKEIVRRGAAAGGIDEGETVEAFLARLHEDREPAELLGDSWLDDVADPFGGTSEQYEVTWREIDELVTALADLLQPSEVPPDDDAAVETVAVPRRSRFGLARKG